MSPANVTLTRKTHHAAVSPSSVAEADQVVEPSPYFLRRKAIFDRVAAAALLVPALPVIGLLAALIRLTSRGPAIYRQVRVGRDGRKFTMYKIRTMRLDAEAATGPTWTQTHDPRVILVGRVLRHLHLDELPQLFNILKGDMSLVGPRPERPEFVHVLADAVPGYMNRLAVVPGVTGLAQLNLPPDSDIDSVRRKLVLDCEYVRQASLWLDLRLILGTFVRMFKTPEAWVLSLLGLGRHVTITPMLEPNQSCDAHGGVQDSATPMSIMIDAANIAVQGDGKASGGHSPAGRHHRHKSSVSKPR